jgi:hypothetical protein
MKMNLELQVRGSDIVYGAVGLLSETVAELRVLGPCREIGKISFSHLTFWHRSFTFKF